MSTRIARLVATASLLTGASAFAQVPAETTPTARRFVDPANGLSLDQAIAHALQQEPSLRSVRSQIDVARGMRTQSSLKPNPSVTFEVRDEPGGTDNQTMVTLEWPLDLFRRSGRVAVADREVQAAQLAVSDRERLLAADVRARYGYLLASVRDLALFDDVVAAARQQHELLEARVEEGASAPLERNVLDVELRRLESERLLQAGQAEAALFELKRALGMRAETALTIRDTLEGLVQRESSIARLTSDTSTIVDERPDVREAAARVDIARAKVDRAQSEGRFDVSVIAGYTRMDAAFPQRGLAPDGSLTRVHGLFHYVSAGAMVTIPLLNRNQGEVAAAEGERAGAEMERHAIQLSAEAELAAAVARDERARQAVNVYSGGAQTLARQNLAVVSQSYELGRVTVLEVLAEQRRYLEVERAYTSALRAAYEARTALNRARGEMR